MNARERLIKALENDGEPDRVPSFAEGMMDKFKKNTLDLYEDEIEDKNVVVEAGDWTLYKFYKFDGVWLHSTPISYKPLRGIKIGKDIDDPTIIIDRFGHVSRLSSNGDYKYQTGCLNDEDAWELWIDAGYFDTKFETSWVDTWLKAYPKLIEADLVPIPVTVCFETIREAFDFGRFSHFYRKKPDFLKMLAGKILENLMDVAKGWCDAGFEIVTWADDCAYKGRVMFPPSIMENIILPIYKKLNDYCHRRGVLTFFHSDGFTEPFFDGLIKSGFNGIQSLEPAAGMDLKHLKETWGNKVCLIGNMDCSDLLPFGTEQQVIDATRQCIADAGSGGGYIFGPTTDITDSCKPANIKTMMDALLQFGTYPIEFK